MNNTKKILTGLVALSGIIGACSFSSLFKIIDNYEALLALCANIKGMEYIVVAAFLGILPAFFKAVHDQTNNRGAMKHS